MFGTWKWKPYDINDVTDQEGDTFRQSVAPLLDPPDGDAENDDEEHRMSEAPFRRENPEPRREWLVD